MAISVPQGLRVLNSDATDDRNVFDTKANALAAISNPFRRHIGLAVWIEEEKQLYRFIEGVDDADLVPDMSATGTITTIINNVVEQLLESEELLDKMKEVFWTKDELRVMTQSEYDTAIGGAGFPEGTVVMIKETL